MYNVYSYIINIMTIPVLWTQNEGRYKLAIIEPHKVLTCCWCRH